MPASISAGKASVTQKPTVEILFFSFNKNKSTCSFTQTWKTIFHSTCTNVDLGISICIGGELHILRKETFNTSIHVQYYEL